MIVKFFDQMYLFSVMFVFCMGHAILFSNFDEFCFCHYSMVKMCTRLALILQLYLFVFVYIYILLNRKSVLTKRLLLKLSAVCVL